MDRTLLIASATLGFLGVAFGAFGAHGLTRSLEGVADGAQRLEWWKTGAQYHLVHALAVGLAAAVASRLAGGLGAISGWLFVAGVVPFSGSLYTMTLTGVRALGAVTPIGGLCFLAGWGALFVGALRAP
jgi:uncharacterized membrane protein YgdD (TMEM256/DUF423 family)